MRISRTLPLLAALAAISPAAFAQGPDVRTSGTFVDKSGAEHPWNITASHALIWDRQTYVPVGGTFSPRYFADGQTEENWAKDAAALDTLKKHGVLDIILNPVVSAPDVPVAAWQKLVDYLDANGFRYGISFGQGVKSPLTGLVVKPGTYRFAGAGDGVDPYWNVSDSDSGRYLITDKTGVMIMRNGEARVTNGVASAAVGSQIEAGAIGLFYPRKVFRSSRDGYLPDLWSGFDSYRDRLIAVLGKVKFGPGLRFFLDPLAHPLGIGEEADYLVPDSPAFKLEWEAFLSQTYQGGIEELMTKWGLQDREIRDYRHAAALVPMNSLGRGVPYMWDTSRNKLVACDPTAASTRFWSDLRECRNGAVVYYIKAVSDLLKREVANVPVIFTHTNQPSFFTNRERNGGFDGLGIAAYARGSALITGGADSAYSDAKVSSKNLWLVVTETLDTNSPKKADVGYASEQALSSDLDWLRQIGAKGFYVNGFQVLPEEQYAKFQLLKSPEQIDWLKHYQDKLTREVDIALSKPNTLAYPNCAAGLVHSGPIGRGGVLWVPSPAPGKTMEFAGSYAGYTITLPEGERTVLWSLRGPRETRLLVPDPRVVEVTTPEGAPIAFKPNLKTRTVTVMIPDTPIVIKPGSDDIFPVEATEDALVQLKQLVEQAQAMKLPVDQYRYQYNQSIRYYKASPQTAFVGAAQALNSIAALVQPYAWIESEGSPLHSFSEIIPDSAASGGGYLILNTETNPSEQGYVMQLHFMAPADDQYTVFLSSTPPGPNVSPFAWLVDAGSQASSSADAVPMGQAYLADKMQWLRLGRVTLKKGEHIFTLRVTGRAPATNRYSLGVDCLLVTRGQFTPSGITKPPLGSISNSGDLSPVQDTTHNAPAPAPKKKK